MSYQIERTKKVTVGTEAQHIDVNCRSFLLVNTSAAATVYFKEFADDGKEVTVDTGFALLPGQMIQTPLCARTLSMIASAADTDVRLLYLTEGL